MGALEEVCDYGILTTLNGKSRKNTSSEEFGGRETFPLWGGEMMASSQSSGGMEVWFPPEANAQEMSVTVNQSLGVLFTFDFM